MNAVLRYEPLVGRLDGLFDEFFRPAFASDSVGREALPIRVDVKENAQAYVVHAEMPGVKKEDIRVEVEGSEVAIAAETRREEQSKEGQKWLHIERRFGRTERRFALPLEVDGDRAEARFVDGVLELTLPKKASASGRRIEVH